MNKIIKTISFYSRLDNQDARTWQSKIALWLKEKHPEITISDDKGDAILVLGGDGTIMEAARKYANDDVFVLGLNLGQLGFLASIGETNDFFPMLDKFFKGEYKFNAGMILNGNIMRGGKSVFSADAFNEIVVQSPLGIVELGVAVDGEIIQEIRGTGVLISTPSGSTAYNISAHGPVVAPNLSCLIITELFDHNLPTPSLVIAPDEAITLKVRHFREHKYLKVVTTSEPADVLFVADGLPLFVLQSGDEINITRTNSAFKLVELQHNHFFKSLRSKFEFK